MLDRTKIIAGVICLLGLSLALCLASAMMAIHLVDRQADAPAALGGVPPPSTNAPEWAFIGAPTVPTAADEWGSVRVMLSNLQDLNATADEALALDVVAVAWEPSWPEDLLNASSTPFDLLAGINARLRAEPPAASTSAALSRHGDSVSLSVPANATSVIVYAPQTREFVFFAWPSGGVFGFDQGSTSFQWWDSRIPAILAKPVGGD